MISLNKTNRISNQLNFTLCFHLLLFSFHSPFAVPSTLYSINLLFSLFKLLFSYSFISLPQLIFLSFNKSNSMNQKWNDWWNWIDGVDWREESCGLWAGGHLRHTTSLHWFNKSIPFGCSASFVFIKEETSNANNKWN